MPVPQEKVYTTDDIYALPDGQRAELIDGRIYNMALPSRMHQEISGGLYYKIRNYIDSKHGECKVYSAPFAVFLNGDSRNYVEPDISVICSKDKLDEKGCNGAPDWIIEVVSPGSTKTDYFIKLFQYRTAGVREYWIVNPMKQTIQTYSFQGIEDSNQYFFTDTVKSFIYNDLEINLSKILQ